MASGEVEKVLAYMRLNNGTDPQGNVKTVSVNIGSLNASAWNPDKALAIADKLENILTKTMVKFQGVVTTTYRVD